MRNSKAQGQKFENVRMIDFDARREGAGRELNIVL